MCDYLIDDKPIFLAETNCSIHTHAKKYLSLKYQKISETQAHKTFTI